MIVFLFGFLCGMVYMICFATCEDLWSNSHRYKWIK